MGRIRPGWVAERLRPADKKFSIIKIVTKSIYRKFGKNVTIVSPVLQMNWRVTWPHDDT